MAGAVQVLQAPNMAGITPTYVAGASQQEVPCSGARSFMLVKNGSGAGLNVTIVGQAIIGGDVTLPDRVVSVPAGTERIIGPIDPGRYAMSNGNAQVNLSATTTITVGYFQLPA